MELSARLWTPEALKAFVEKRPLNSDDVNYFLNDLLKRVVFLPETKKAFLDVDSLWNPEGFIVKLGLGYPLGERKIALIS